MKSRPGRTNGMRHVALFVEQFEQAEKFYVELLGMEVEWRPDPDNVYLTSGNDNLALHRAETTPGLSNLDHIGFFVNDIDQIDIWYEFLEENQVTLLTRPRLHRDGAKSFYCKDPAGIKVQIIFHPPIAAQE